jgi:ABC-type multidrug transport system ATPase subunit
LLATGPTPTTATALTVRGMSRRFGSFVAFPPVDLDVAPGERIALRGPNGSGKTTFLRCVAGTLLPSEGEAVVGGDPAGSVAARHRVGASLAVERSFYLRLTGWANLLLFARLRHETERAARLQTEGLVEELELADIAARRLDSCSTGMLQQLAFARALLGAPELLLLDEPTRSLDADAIERLWGAVGRRSGLAVLIATHRPDDVDRCVRTVGFAR